jgi:MoaA/NifB/PqqE/SkfB family radical SAM enzyme
MSVSNIDLVRCSYRESHRLLGRFFDLPDTTLAIEIAESCNLKCAGCWVGISRDGLGLPGPIQLMNDHALSDAMNFGREFGLKKLSLIGGEPTLHPNIVAIIKNGLEMGYERVSITTNGVLGEGRLIEILESGISNVTFSVDGSTPEVHDEIRPSFSGKSTFTRTIRNVERAVMYAKDCGFSVKINHTIFPENYHDALDMMYLVESMNVDGIRFHYSMPGDRGDASEFISPNDWSRLVDAVHEARLGMTIISRTRRARRWYGVHHSQ